MKFDVKLEGQPTAEKIRAAPDLLKRYLLAAFIESAGEIISGAQPKIHSISGDLAGNFRVGVKDSGDRYEVKVENDQYYAGWVELGHNIVRRGERNQARLKRRIGAEMRRIPAHPYFFSTFAQLRSGISAKINDAIERAERETEG